MIDERLKEYLQLRKDGYLEFKEKTSLTDTNKANVCKLTLPKEEYFVKWMYEKYGKGVVDAEVLLGRVYQKLGLNSAIYYPLCIDGSKNIVISKSIRQKGDETAAGFANDVMASSVNMKNPFLNFDVLKFRDDLSNSHLNTIQNFLKYSNVDFFRQLFLTRGLDLGTFNYDRNLHNYFVYKNGDKAEGIGLFDFEASAVRQFIHNGFYNDFNNREDSEDLISDFIQNEAYQEYITRFEIAEAVGSAPFEETAREVEDEIGYKVSESFVEEMKSNCDKVAEELAK